jgi:hypothetical protein
MNNNQPAQPSQSPNINPDSNPNLRFIQQALSNTLEPSVPPIERVDMLAAIALVLLEKAKLSGEAESTFLEHIMLAQYGTSGEWDEHRNCIAKLHRVTAEIAMQRLINMEQADNSNSATTDNFEFPKELNTL